MSLRLIAAFVALSGVVTSDIVPVPGVQYMGSPIGILYGLDLYGSIIEHNYSSGMKTGDYKYDVPDAVVVSPNVRCAFSAEGFTSSSYEEYQKEYSSSFKIGGSFGKFSAAYSTESQNVKKTIAEEDQASSYISASCVEYNLDLHRSGATLQNWFIDEVLALPTTLNASANPNDPNLAEYFSFFDYYGTHILTGCEIGGKLSQVSFTDSTYVEQYSQSKTTEQASVKFFVSVDQSQTSSVTIDDKYKTSTTTMTINNEGGRWPDSTDNWNPWIQSVQALQNVACVRWTAEELTAVWAWDRRLIGRAPVAEQALAAYFHRPGCTDPMAFNYDRNALIDDGSCVASAQFRVCFQETEGSPTQCHGNRNSCSKWSGQASKTDDSSWTGAFVDLTNNAGGGCKYQWKLVQKPVPAASPIIHKYRVCFRETANNAQCQGARNTCSGWNTAPAWSVGFRDDTDNRGGGCQYQWMIEEHVDDSVSSRAVNECRICFHETEGSSQCQGNRNSCSGWSSSDPKWTAAFRDNTDSRGDACTYSWKLECR